LTAAEAITGEIAKATMAINATLVQDRSMFPSHPQCYLMLQGKPGELVEGCAGQ
jgi:hypothetical protein